MKTLEELVNDAAEVCYEIEKFPSSHQQTELSILASNLRRNLDQLQKEMLRVLTNS